MILPVTDDRDSGPFFQAAREGRLVYRACAACNRGIHPPLPFCPACGGDGEWREASGRGHVHCSTTVTHQIHPDYRAPYTLAAVELAESPEVRLMARLDGAIDLAAGTPMRVVFDEVAEGIVLPNWQPA